MVSNVLECYACVVPVCLCNTAVSRKLGYSCQEILREFHYVNNEKAKKVSVLGEKPLLKERVLFQGARVQCPLHYYDCT